MKRWTGAVAALALAAVGCEGQKQAESTKRATLTHLGGSLIEVVPAEGQLPYCMVFTVAEKGTVRQLTLTRENRSIRCEAKKPVANRSFRIPPNEGKVAVYVFFSNERVQAGPIAQQLYEAAPRGQVSAMDFRAPGQLFVERLDFIPEEAAPPAMGGVVGAGGAVQGQDAGTPAAGGAADAGTAGKR